MALIIAAKAACIPSQLEDRISKGFRAAEIITFENQLNHSFNLMQRVLRNYSNSLELVSIHAPSELMISDIIDEDCRKRGLLCLEKTIKLAAKIGCKRVVFHAFQHIAKLGTINEMLSLREKASQKCIEGIQSLDHLCEDFDVTLCLENINACIYLNRLLYIIFSASPHDLIRVVKEVDSDFLKLCFDVAHAKNTCNFIFQNPKMQALFGDTDKLTLKGFYETIIDHIDLIHLSDAKSTIASKGTDNLPLGKGQINFRNVLKLILEKGQESPIVLEIDEPNVNNAINMMRGREFLSRIITQLRPKN